MNLSGKTILICEEALIDYKGHFYTWINAIRNMHLDAGAEVFVAGNRGVAPQVKESLQVLPVYSVNSWDQPPGISPWHRYARLLAHNIRVFVQTRRALKQTGPVDLLFFTAARVDHLIGLRLLCAWGLERWFRRLIVFLPQSQAQYNADYTEFRFKSSAKLIREEIRSFRRFVEKGRVILAGDSHITCREYETLAGVPFTLFPSPGGSLKYRVNRKRDPGHGPVFSILGVSAYHKGIDVFQSAILLFLKMFPDTNARFILQWGAPVITPEGKRIEIEPALRASPRVSLFEKRLSFEEYARLFRETDVVVLPYRRMTYFNRLSGVAVEAACSGKPMIVTENTWLDWALREFGTGAAIPENGVAELSEQFKQFSTAIDEMSGKAVARAKIALEYNSMERYLGILWNDLRSTARVGV